MAKSDSEALNKLKQLIDAGKSIQIEKRFNGYEITIYSNTTLFDKNHNHYNGETIIEAIMKINDVF